MAIVTIIGAGMMGSALAFPARENGHEVRLVGTHLDREIIDACRKEDKHPKFDRVFPAGIKYYQIEEVEEAIAGSTFIIGGVSSFGVDWFVNFLHTQMYGKQNVKQWARNFLSTQSAAHVQVMN